ncbi:MAG TPA: conjugal transfer protein [Ruminococcaceae bacterium]|nr:conjugal transfer protein [Oscillospiraceae bacterium]
MDYSEEKWILCPLCGGKTRLRLLQGTVLQNFPLFCPKCKRESIINAQNYNIEIISSQPDAKTQC